MKTHTVPAALAAAALLGSATAALGAAPAPDFAGLDTDGDGSLSAAEWAASPIAAAMGEEVAAAHYRMYDIDGDGTVSDVEYSEVNRQASEGLRQKAI